MSIKHGEDGLYEYKETHYEANSIIMVCHMHQSKQRNSGYRFYLPVLRRDGLNRNVS